MGRQDGLPVSEDNSTGSQGTSLCTWQASELKQLLKGTTPSSLSSTFLQAFVCSHSMRSRYRLRWKLTSKVRWKYSRQQSFRNVNPNVSQQTPTGEKKIFKYRAAACIHFNLKWWKNCILRRRKCQTFPYRRNTVRLQKSYKTCLFISNFSKLFGAWLWEKSLPLCLRRKNLHTVQLFAQNFFPMKIQAPKKVSKC